MLPGDAAIISPAFRGRIASRDQSWFWQDPRRNYGKDRFRAVGESEGDILHVMFTWRSDRLRFISVRRAN